MAAAVGAAVAVSGRSGSVVTVCLVRGAGPLRVECQAMIYKLEPRRTALLIIDAQREYFDEDGALFTPHALEIRANLMRLLAAARTTGTRVVFVRHVQTADGSDIGRMADFDSTASFIAGTTGVEIIPELEPAADEPVVDKTRYSAFVNTRLESILKTSGVDTLIVAGLMTQYCSVTTTRHGHDLTTGWCSLPMPTAGRICRTSALARCRTPTRSASSRARWPPASPTSSTPTRRSRSSTPGRSRRADWPRASVSGRRARIEFDQPRHGV
jgi:nicotinamidase-related amidase